VRLAAFGNGIGVPATEDEYGTHTRQQRGASGYLASSCWAVTVISVHSMEIMNNIH
jgi:hypothetical protein